MLVYQSLLTALGWSLLDSLWQIALLWLIYRLLTFGHARFSAGEKYNLALLFVIIATSWFTFSLIHIICLSGRQNTVGLITVSDQAARWIPTLSSAYLIFQFLGFIRHQVLYYRDRLTEMLKPEMSGLQDFINRQTRLMGIRKEVEVFLSDLVSTAETSGHCHPLILLPVSLVTRLTPSQLEVILIHELLHIKRNDYLIHICVSCFRTIFFFNPFACFFYNEISKQRELACDDGVIELCYAPELYAEALFCLEKIRQVKPDFALAVDGKKPGQLVERIKRLIDKPLKDKIRFHPLLIFNALFAIAIFCLQVQISTGPFEPYKSVEPRARALVNPIKNDDLVGAIEFPNHQVVIVKDRSIKLKSKPILDLTTGNQISTERAEIVKSTDIADQRTETSVVIPVSSSFAATAEMSFNYRGREKEIRNEMTKVIKEVRTETATKLNMLEREVIKKSQQIRTLTRSNQLVVGPSQKNLQPIINRLHRQIILKKEEIDRLKIKLIISDEEIIHI